MNLIHFRGLNCYFNCVITIAAFLGIKYEDSFTTLWAETEFSYDPRLNAYSSKRMLANLEAMGVRFDCLGCALANEAERVLTPCQAGELVIVGMDAFFMPWSPIFEALHDPHYFIARKEKSGSFSCFDPTYGKKDVRITLDDITAHAFDICRIEESAHKLLRTGLAEAAREIAYCHPLTKEKLLIKVNGCLNEKRQNAAGLARYVDTLINNRYLFKHYLENSPTPPAMDQQLFDKDFFLRWEAAKNGLYKASMIENNEGVLNEVCGLVTNLMEEELSIARQILTVH